jgi:hypothetical protein
VMFAATSSLCCAAESQKLPQADYYVAPDGNDSWTGRLAEPNAAITDGPFATVAKARDTIRRIKGQSGKKDFLVLLRGGNYRLTETLVFNLEDSAPRRGTITYAAYPGETPVLGSGVPIGSWQRLTSDPDDLPAAARGKVWVADGPAALRQIHTLYDGRDRLPRARTDGFAPAKDTDQKKIRSPDQFEFPPGALKNWPDLREAELLIIPSCDYEMNILPLASVDESNRIARTTLPATRGIGPVKYFDKTIWAENVLAALDQPGEWVYHSATRKIYFWPKGEAPSQEIVAPQLTELVRVEGKIDYEGRKDKPVTGLVFRGLTFIHAERLPWHGDTGWSLQHSWEKFDRPSAAVRFRGASGCAVEACRFTALSGSGMRLDLTCQRNRVGDNEFAHIGAVAVLLAGYGPGTKDVNHHNEVVNNHVHHCGEIYWAAPAIMVWQSGNNRVANNLIHHTPYSGIVVDGRITMNPGETEGDGARTVRWKEFVYPKFANDHDDAWYKFEKYLHSRQNEVAHNEIHHVMETMGDGNGIYISGCGKENHIYQNFIHDCLGASMGAGIRCDDFQYETILEGNVLHHISSVQVGISMTGKNDIIDNIIADIFPSPRPLAPANIVHGYICLPAEYPYGRKYTRIDLAGARIQRNIVYSYRKDYFPVLEHGSFSKGPGDRLKETRTDHNLYWCPEDPQWGQRYLDQQQTGSIERFSCNADPLFMDIARGDLRLKPESPAWKLGFHPIDVSQIGLLPNHPYFRGETAARQN